MKNNYKFMPMYWEDHTIDTLDLTVCEYGALMLLIGRYWMSGEALPDDDRVLAGTTRQSLAEWLEMRPRLMRFFRCQDGKLVQKRIETEMANCRAKAEKNRQNVSARWRKDAHVVIPMRRAALDDDPFA